MVNTVIDAKHGKKKIEYPHALSIRAARDLGCSCQEQASGRRSRRLLARWRGSHARAMGKKEKRIETHGSVLDGCGAERHLREKAGIILRPHRNFAGYVFKTRSAAYGLITSIRVPVSLPRRVHAARDLRQDKTERREVHRERAARHLRVAPDINGSERRLPSLRSRRQPGYSFGRCVPTSSRPVDSIRAARADHGRL